MEAIVNNELEQLQSEEMQQQLVQIAGGKRMSDADTRPGAILKNNLWTNNPIFMQVLGICSALAVTNLLTNTRS